MPCKWLQLWKYEMTECARLSRLSINAVTSVVAEAPNKSNDLKSVSACLGGNISGLELPKVTVLFCRVHRVLYFVFGSNLAC